MPSQFNVIHWFRPSHCNLMNFNHNRAVISWKIKRSKTSFRVYTVFWIYVYWIRVFTFQTEHFHRFMSMQFACCDLFYIYARIFGVDSIHAPVHEYKLNCVVYEADNWKWSYNYQTNVECRLQTLLCWDVRVFLFLNMCLVLLCIRSWVSGVFVYFIKG